MAGWALIGDTLLAPTGVAFSAWLRVVDSVVAHGDLPVSSTQADALVAHGFLRRVYAIPEDLA